MLAGPGSGKTGVICQRARILIQEYHILPQQILVLTYTKAACESMSSRFRRLSDCNVQFRTVHSLCYYILKKENQLFQSEEELSQEQQFQFYLDKTLELFETDPIILKKYQNYFSYILVDEFQDIDQLQFHIICKLAENHKNIMAVGDDDQSIYGFRGAYPNILSKFLEKFPEAQKILLNVNYRCSKEIMEVANRCIIHNKERFEKEIITTGRTSKIPSKYIFQSEKHQIQWILQDIKNKVFHGELWNEMMVIFRTGEEVRKFLLCAKLEGLPCGKVKWDLNDFFIIDDLCAYIRMVIQEWNVKDFLAIMNHPERGIDRNLINKNMKSFEEVLDAFSNEKSQNQFQKTVQLINEIEFIKRVPPYIGVSYWFDAMGYRNYAKHRMEEVELSFFNYEIIERWILDEAKKTKNWKEFLNEIELDWREKMNNIDEGVCASTYHGVKGLEFSVVYLPDLNEGFMPLPKAVQEYGMEEERRLFYVGITRAKHEVVFCYVDNKNGRKKKISQFLTELGDDLLNVNYISS